jgi:hypothetical protein
LGVQPVIKNLAVEQIRLDGNTQSRAMLSNETIERYSEAMQAGDRFPPIDVFYDGLSYWLADGFHRLAAVRLATRLTLDPLIEAQIHSGDHRAALLYSIGANATHGLPRTNEDKRRSVLLMLKDTEWQQWSDSAIAKVAKVSQPFVGNVRREMSVNSVAQSTLRRNVKGVVMDTTRIGRPPKYKHQSTELPARSRVVSGQLERSSEYKGPERRAFARREADRLLIAEINKNG